MFDYKEQRIKQCLRCPVCHTVLENYSTILDIVNGKKKDDELVNELADLLQIEGTISEKLKILALLKGQYKKPVKSLGNDMECLCSINRVVSSVIQFISDNNDYEGLLEETTPRGFRILHEMLDCLTYKGKVKNKNYLNAEDFFNEFQHKKVKAYVEGTEIPNGYTEDNEPDWEAYGDALQAVYNDYAYGNMGENGVAPYQYCDVKYNRPGLENCHSVLFMEMVKQQKKAVSTLQISDLGQYEDIYFEFLEQMPKHCGKTLRKVVERQQLEDKDIIWLLNLKTASRLQAWYKSEKPSTLEENLKDLARCLLVSEDVLICGTGERYGSWEEVLSDDGLDKIKKDQGLDSLDEARVWVRTQIEKWLAMSSAEFEKMIKDNPDFFTREPFYAYEIEEDGVSSPDYVAMKENVLHPEELEILVSVLRSQESKG